MRKAGEQFEMHCLFKFPNHIPKLKKKKKKKKEERRRTGDVLSHCKAGAQFKSLSSSPKEWF
jgi:hypothetical protein